jgi:hypothetical protein
VLELLSIAAIPLPFDMLRPVFPGGATFIVASMRWRVQP